MSATATDPAGNTSEFSADSIVTTAGGSYVVTTTADSGAGSLRAAIEAADASMGRFTIDFDIPTATRIRREHGHLDDRRRVGLPALTEPVTIDGYSQPGWNPTAENPVIILTGTNAGQGSDGFDLEADGVAILGLQINGFSGDAIDVASNDNVVQDVIVGLAANLATPVPDGVGIYITGADNLIGANGQDGYYEDTLAGDWFSHSVPSGDLGAPDRAQRATCSRGIRCLTTGKRAS